MVIKAVLQFSLLPFFLPAGGNTEVATEKGGGSDNDEIAADEPGVREKERAAAAMMPTLESLEGTFGGRNNG